MYFSLYEPRNKLAQRQPFLFSKLSRFRVILTRDVARKNSLIWVGLIRHGSTIAGYLNPINTNFHFFCIFSSFHPTYHLLEYTYETTMTTSDTAAVTDFELGFFSLKIDFDGIMTPQVLQSAASGIGGMLDTTSRLFSAVVGEDINLQHISIGHVQAGSCGFEDIKAYFKDIGECLKTIKDMDHRTLFIVCTAALSWIAINKYGEYKIAELAAESGKTISTQTGVFIENSTIRLKDNLLNLCPNLSDDLLEKIIEELAKLQEKSPRAMRRYAKGLVEATHPGGETATGITMGVSDNKDTEKTLHRILDEEAINRLPDKLPPEEPKELEEEYCKNVQIEVIKIDKESKADTALQCRILDEDYSQKKCPLVIHRGDLRTEIMQRFPQNINVNLYIVRKKNAQGEVKIVRYVLDDIIK